MTLRVVFAYPGGRAIFENTQPPEWEQQPDGSRARPSNGIRIIDRTPGSPAPEPRRAAIEHLVTWCEDGGRVVVLGLDARCRPVYTTTLYDWL